MSKENIIKKKSFAFAVRIVNLYKYLSENKEFVLSKQLLRSGTAIGAIYREAEHAESTPDFIHKLAMAQKEANESIYWIELLNETDYLSKEQFQSIHKDASGLYKLITSIIITTKKKHQII